MNLTFPDDTIVAVSTPPGRGAISVVRLSGPQAPGIAGGIFRPRAAGRAMRAFRPTLGSLPDADGKPLDEVLLSFFPAPRSYTGEDVVEISCHGSPVVVQSIIDCLLSRGARLAEPGEFSLRAFFHGKMDLSQAEGIRDLVQAQTRKQVELARRQMQGSFSARVAPAKSRLIDIIVQLETAVEFVDEPVSPRSREVLVGELDTLQSELSRLARSFETGRLLREGWLMVLAGRPNVGKSSLFNRFVAEERAIVTDIPGTTRDTLRETIDLAGIPVTVVDTAGIRAPRGRVEKEGVQRTQASVADAHLVLMVLDATQGWTAADEEVWRAVTDKRVVVVWNKMDLLMGKHLQTRDAMGDTVVECRVSAKTGDGIESLKQKILETGLPGGLSDEDLVVTSLRHRGCLERTVAALVDGRNALAAGLSEEFAVADLRRALESLGEITGETLVEDILQKIFSEFCIGK